MTPAKIRNPFFARTLCAGLLLGPLCAGHVAAQSQASGNEAEVFARVGEQVITLGEYRSAFAAGVRQKFYHARPPEDELARFQREVGEKLIDQALLAREAQRRGIVPDRARIDAQVAEYEKRYAGNERWQNTRANVLPRLVRELERRSRLERLEANVRSVPLPDPADARAYYEANPGLFTEPEQVRLSLILLKVNPASPDEVWDEAMARGQRLHARLKQGADFAELARLNSADPSAERGGDLGYVHRGMLPESIEKQVIETLHPGAASAPVRLLEGVAIVRLEARKPARLREFADVSRSARELLQRERGEKAWQTLVAELRAAKDVQVIELRYAQPRAN